jgi:gliding motility-associated-like protein
MSLNIHKPYFNTVHFTVKKCALLLLFLIAAPSLYAQFTVTAVPTPETCDGNGSLALSVQNASPGATINYIVYYLGPTGASAPVLVWNNASPNVPGQQDGVYSVEAHQFAGTVEILPSAPPVQVTIANNNVAMDFALTGKPILCGNDGEISVTMITGTAVTYKLTAPDGTSIGPQASATFTGLSHNVLYTVVATNACGEGLPHSLTLFEAIPVFAISPALFTDVELPACDQLTIRNDIFSTNSVPITYPLQAKFTVTHYDGTVNVYDVAIPNGEEATASAQIVVDYHYGEDCHYHVEFTDTCGNVYTSPELPINPVLGITGEMVIIKCNGRNIKYTPFKYVGPFTLEFVNPPAGFNPADYNSQYPGPYTGADVPIVFGDEDTPLPEGDYIVKIHDQCDRTPDGISNTIAIELPEIEISVITYPATCVGGGRIEASIPGLPIGVGTMTSGDDEFSDTYPVDLDQYIQNKINKKRDEIEINNMPPGTYFIILKDTCGREYPGKEFTIQPYNGDKASYLARPDCQVGFGTLQVSGAALEYIEMIAAPAAFSSIHPLPYNVTQHVNPTDGLLYMNQLPPGQYKFKAHNDCDDDIEMPVTAAVVSAYNITVDDYNLIPHCGAFDLFLNHQSTGTAFVGFYLQQWDETAQQWRHPDPGGGVYIQGEKVVGDTTVPLADRNALKLTNNATNYNLIYPTGKYRIIKQYQTFGDGEKGEGVVLCTPTLYEFEYYSDLTIAGAVSLDCMGSSGNVQINAFGVPPLTYSLIAPTFVDNGTNNIFSGLTSGVYTVEVKDQCGHVQPLTFNVAEIPSLVHVPDPSELDSMEACDTNGDGKETFDISGYTPIILDGQDPAFVTITYHTSQNNAETGANPIPDPTSVNTGTATIYARATHILNINCVAITWFQIIVNPMPELTMKETWGGCEGQTVTITADNGFSSYEWKDASGDVIGNNKSITVSNEGSYTVTVKDAIGCEGSKTVEVVKSPIPVINTVTIKDWTDQDNVLTVVMEPTEIPGNYVYSLDNEHFQHSPVFNGLPPGQYTIYVKDEFGCGDDQFETYILTYPKFFTPNGDGINEYWKIYLSILEPDMLVYIYDRYGKLITGFGADSKGWDGTLNGAHLPATDYWFVIKRQNGQVLKGHFSMIR